MRRRNLNKLLIICLIFLGCKTDNFNGIVIETTLVTHQSYSQNRKMVFLIESSLNRDSNAFKQLINFPNGGGESSYNLGYVITQIMYRIGEEEIIKMITHYNQKELNHLKGYVNVGLEYGDNNYDGKMDDTRFKIIFPKLIKYIDEKL